MGGIDFIIIAIIGLIVGGAIGYIIRAKKRGQKCIGCPHSATCASHCCSASSQQKNKDHTNNSQ
jgi:hypothetical protein